MYLAGHAWCIYGQHKVQSGIATALSLLVIDAPSMGAYGH
jgi:hypothetical protein